MRRPLCLLILSAILLGSWYIPAAHAAPAAAPAPPQAQAAAPHMAAPDSLPTIDTTAHNAFLIDLTTHTVLLDKNGSEHMPTSSMSKMLTAYVIFDALKAGKITLQTPFTVSERAWKMEGSRSFMDVHSQVPVEQLIRGLVIQSGNDAAVVLAEGLAASEESFMQLANAKAAEMGLKDSHFTNAAGLPDPQHYSTARDLAMLAAHLISDFPEYYHYFGEKEFLYNNIKQGNRNPLLYRNMGVDGLKTGHAEAAGYGIAASAVRDGRRLVLVLNGLPSMQARADESAKLLNWGFANFVLKSLFKQGDSPRTATVVLGEKKTVPLIVEDAVQLTVSQLQATQIKTRIEAPETLPAPIEKGTVVGKVIVSIGDKDVSSTPLLAGESVPRLGFFHYYWAKFMFWLSGKYE